MEQVRITEEHRWLTRLLGDWAVEDPNRDGSAWLETVSSIGETFIQATGTGQMPNGEPAMTVMTLGFDPRLGRFVGTYAGSMMTNQWVYEGELDDSKTVLTLRTEGPSMDDEQRTAAYKDVITIVSDDVREMRSVMQGEDGDWKEIMKMTYRRR